MKKLNKRAIMVTLEVVLVGIFIVMLVAILLSFNSSHLVTRKVHVDLLLQDDEFRNAIVNENLSLASQICQEYFEKLNYNCSVKIMGLNSLYYENETKAVIKNIFLFGNAYSEKDFVVRLFLTPLQK